MPDWALQTWKDWKPVLLDCPSIICRLNGGKTNESWLLDTSRGKAVLRIGHPTPRLLGINRAHEAIILSTLQNKLYIPNVWYQNQKMGIQVTQFIEGEVFTGQSLVSSDAHALRDIIADYQEACLALPRMNYYEYLCAYWEECVKLDLLENDWGRQWQEFLPRLKDFQASNWKEVLCHHDLRGDNIVKTSKGLYILDWEYASLGHPQFDGCSVMQGSNAKDELSNDEIMLEKILLWLERLWSVLNQRES